MPTNEPKCMGNSSMELGEYILELRQAQRKYNADKMAIAIGIESNFVAFSLDSLCKNIIDFFTIFLVRS